MRKLEPIASLCIRRPNMVKRGLVYSKQNWKWIEWKSGLCVGYYEESKQCFHDGSSRSKPLCYRQWCVQNYCYFYIVVRAGDNVKLSYKVGDENARENQTKPRWVWSGRHSENGMGCGKRKWWEKVLWWGEKFPRLVLGVMDVVKWAGLIVTLGGDWGAQAPWELLPFKL